MGKSSCTTSAIPLSSKGGEVEKGVDAISVHDARTNYCLIVGVKTFYGVLGLQV